MIQRSKPRQWRDKPNYFKLQVGDRELWFRLPFRVYSQRIVSEMNARGLVEKFRRREKDEERPEISPRDLETLWEVWGAAIGYCWYGETLDLEANPRDFDDAADFGAEVLQELADEGFSDDDFVEPMPEMFSRIVGQLVPDVEVSRRANFSEAQMDPGSSGS